MRGVIDDKEHDYSAWPMSTERGLTERDRYDSTKSDLVVCNLLGAQRVSIGTMIELGWADANRVPVVLIMEKTGNIHEHPMVRQTTSFRVEDLVTARDITEAVLLAHRG
jgi:nucleoside 2-deoxyribosyltransferase